ncbi:MAG: 50S ribosomal protein L4 [Candidatus Latescibacteria bacterium]|nr:50S ribosomal protein L4 [Candidatus Latescibacterota bacterium]
MKTVTVYNKDGSEAGTIDLPQDIFGIEPSATAIYQVIKAHLANRRQGTASTKTRSEVNLSKQKLFRQKGTGRARAGSANSPVWVGGGVAFGPKPRSYNQKINRKLKKLAMKSAYSIKAQEDNIKVVEDFSFDEIKTRNIAEVLKALGIKGGKTIFLLSANDEILQKSSQNIPGLNLKVAENANTYELMNSDVLLLARTAVDKVKEYFDNES